jgi:hypothetical protein
MENKTKVWLVVIFLAVVGFSIFLMSNPQISGGAIIAAAQCRDKIDNDGDGKIDYPNDPGCISKTDPTERNANVECDDGKDNDGDGKIDYLDPGCSSLTDNDETNCGDSRCEGGETQGSCPQDCGFPNSCSDSDNGKNPSVVGTASGYLNNAQYSSTDVCFDSQFVTEYYCSAASLASEKMFCGNDTFGAGYCLNGSVHRLILDRACIAGACSQVNSSQLVEVCTYGCANGLCNSAPQQNACADSDGGVNKLVKGTVTGYYAGYAYSYTDFCNSTILLSEYYCIGPSKYLATMFCTNGTATCSDGRCI